MAWAPFLSALRFSAIISAILAGGPSFWKKSGSTHSLQFEQKYFKKKEKKIEM